MVRMRVNHAGIERLRSRTNALILTNADKAGPFMIEMDKVHVRQARKAYTTRGASTGAAWKPLSPGYAKWKRKVKPGRPILVFSGDTRGRFLEPSNANHIRRFIAPFRYQFGVASSKAWAAENGIGEPGQNLPRRSVLHKTAADIKELQAAFAAFYIKWVHNRLRHL